MLFVLSIKASRKDSSEEWSGTMSSQDYPRVTQIYDEYNLLWIRDNESQPDLDRFFTVTFGGKKVYSELEFVDGAHGLYMGNPTDVKSYLSILPAPAPTL